MTREATELRREIATLQREREELNAQAALIEDDLWWLTHHLDLPAARLREWDLDEIEERIDELSDQIGLAQRDLSEIEGRIGRAEHIADVAFERNP